MSNSDPPGSSTEYTSLRVADLSATERYKLLIGAIVPRPIAWVSTMGKAGVANLAPFSFYNGLSSDPMCLMISVGYQDDGELKDTARNILESGEFVVHESPLWAIDLVHESSAPWPYSVDEIERLGLTTLPSAQVRPPRIAQSPIHFECVLRDQVALGEPKAGAHILFVGEVVQVHIQGDAYQDGRILLDRIQPVARMAGPTYMSVGHTFDRPRAKT